MQVATADSGQKIYDTIFNLRNVSYLAQTRMSAPVILYSPECVDGVATAEL
jgi:hypothetical protein